jgi:hypothetical protein
MLIIVPESSISPIFRFPGLFVIPSGIACIGVKGRRINIGNFLPRSIHFGHCFVPKVVLKALVGR